MPAERMQAFLKVVANRLREGTASITDPVALASARAKITSEISDEQRVLAQAIGSEGFRNAAAAAYASELANHQQGVLLDEAKRETDSLLNNRIVDCGNYIRLLAQADFLAAAHAQALQPAEPAKEFTLSATKIAEEVDSMVLPYRPTGQQPAIHVGMTARGHQVGHQALADIFRPNAGQLRAPLVHALAVAWPTASGAMIEKIAGDWLKARHDPAHAIADALKPNGIIYKQAMAKAEALQQQKLAAGNNAPTTTTDAPRTSIGTITQRDAAELTTTA